MAQQEAAASEGNHAEGSTDSRPKATVWWKRRAREKTRWGFHKCSCWSQKSDSSNPSAHRQPLNQSFRLPCLPPMGLGSRERESQIRLLFFSSKVEWKGLSARGVGWKGAPKASWGRRERLANNWAMGKHSAVPASSSKRGSKQTPEPFCGSSASLHWTCWACLQALTHNAALQWKLLERGLPWPIRDWLPTKKTRKTLNQSEPTKNSAGGDPNVKWHEGS